ncbi:MAG TPA: serine--tRNA ligase [Thermomonas sp.]|nr:serine--tRNA ligase [Thermomonas sp.]
MLDIKWIRENAEMLDAALAERGAEPLSASLIALDERRRTNLQALQDMQSRRNAASKEIGAAMAQKNSELADKLKAEVAELKTTMPALEEENRLTDAALIEALSSIPNIPLDDVPVGSDEHGNVVKHSHGQKPGWNHQPKEHFEIGEELGWLDFEGAARIAGSRFTIVKGQLARLERALGQFMLDLHTGEHGYEETNVPVIVNADAMRGTGQLPKFEEDLFATQLGEHKRYLIPTSEVPLTNIVRDAIVEADALPLRMTAHSMCFRSEAGSAGRDTRGFIRQHQFEKVELVSISKPEESDAEHERMTRCAEVVLEKLGLPYRKVLLCTGDMGFGATKTYDLEVWLPSQATYREISSCSNCGDFQARRMQARWRNPMTGKPEPVHTLNGSGVAVGRALIAVMENYQNADGSIDVPEALRPYMGGLERIA